MGLLHSPTFRSNLIRWIILYIGVLCLITTVVTYSKYISTASGENHARTAKFKIDVEVGDICSTTSPDLCNLTSYKPYDTLEYNLKVDASEMEVTTDIVVNIYIDSEFKVISLYDVSTDELVTFNDASQTIVMQDGQELKYFNNKITITGEASLTNQFLKNYKLNVKYIDEATYVNYVTEHSYPEFVKIEYSAIQKN